MHFLCLGGKYFFNPRTITAVTHDRILKRRRSFLEGWTPTRRYEQSNDFPYEIINYTHQGRIEKGVKNIRHDPGKISNKVVVWNLENLPWSDDFCDLNNWLGLIVAAMKFIPTLFGWLTRRGWFIKKNYIGKKS